jgi:hypothetical protein
MICRLEYKLPQKVLYINNLRWFQCLHLSTIYFVSDNILFWHFSPDKLPLITTQVISVKVEDYFWFIYIPQRDYINTITFPIKQFCYFIGGNYFYSFLDFGFKYHSISILHYPSVDGCDIYVHYIQYTVMGARANYSVIPNTDIV